VSSSIFTMTGGEISGNTATNSGGGASLSGTLSITGGTISNNRAQNGGGLSVTSNLSQLSNLTVTGNVSHRLGLTAAYGGGMYLSGSAALTASNLTVNGNTGENGGGIYRSGSGVLSFNGGTINNNRAVLSGEVTGIPSGGDGGGVYVAGPFTLLSGEVSGNTADADGNGIYVPASDRLTLSPVDANAITFGADDDIYLPSEISFDIGADLSTGLPNPVKITFGDAYIGDVVAFTPSATIAGSSVARLAVTAPIVLGVNGGNIVILNALHSRLR
jgi:hypothetical protein